MSTEATITIDTFKTVTKAIAQSGNLDILANHLTQLLVSALTIRGCAIFILDIAEVVQVALPPESSYLLKI